MVNYLTYIEKLITPSNLSHLIKSLPGSINYTIVDCNPFKQLSRFELNATSSETKVEYKQWHFVCNKLIVLVKKKMTKIMEGNKYEVMYKLSDNRQEEIREMLPKKARDDKKTSV